MTGWPPKTKRREVQSWKGLGFVFKVCQNIEKIEQGEERYGRSLYSHSYQTITLMSFIVHRMVHQEVDLQSHMLCWKESGSSDIKVKHRGLRPFELK